MAKHGKLSSVVESMCIEGHAALKRKRYWNRRPSIKRSGRGDALNRVMSRIPVARPAFFLCFCAYAVLVAGPVKQAALWAGASGADSNHMELDRCWLTGRGQLSRGSK
jgi:hypothetical protein